jgi:hypothetical protein
MRTILFVVIVSVSGAACITGRAATPAERPALEVPMPPSRTIPQLPPPESTPMPEPVEDLPSAAKPSSPVRNSRPPATRDAKETQKPEPKPETAPPPVDPAPPQPQTPPLRMPSAGDTTAISRQVTDIIERTRRTLNGVDYGQLTAVRKKAYDDAKLFAQQAEDALKQSNLVFAKELADKAERLAKELQK